MDALLSVFLFFGMMVPLDGFCMFIQCHDPVDRSWHSVAKVDPNIF